MLRVSSSDLESLSNAHLYDVIMEYFAIGTGRTRLAVRDSDDSVVTLNLFNQIHLIVRKLTG